MVYGIMVEFLLGGLSILSHICIYLRGQSEDNYDNLGD